MKKLQIFAVMAMLVSLSSCQAIGDIFKAGMGFGIFLVVVVIGLLIFIIAKVAGGGSK